MNVHAHASPPAARRARFEVDEDLCIGCGLCEERAPENLEVAPGEGTARVVKQPDCEEEERACTEAVDYCPTGGLSRIPAEPPAARLAPEPARAAPRGEEFTV